MVWNINPTQIQMCILYTENNTLYSNDMLKFNLYIYIVSKEGCTSLEQDFSRVPCHVPHKKGNTHTRLWEVTFDDKHVISPGIVMVTWIYHFASRLQTVWILVGLFFINKHFPITFLHLQELQQDCTNSWPLLNGLLQWKGRWESALVGWF